jgi:ribosomal protein S14
MSFFKKKDNLNRMYLKKKEFSLIFFNVILRSKQVCRFFKRRLLKGILVLRFGRIRNTCVITGRARGVYRSFKSSRHALRGLTEVGYLPGIKKSSW